MAELTPKQIENVAALICEYVDDVVMGRNTVGGAADDIARVLAPALALPEGEDWKQMWTTCHFFQYR